jgi:hypothetical protein
VSFCYARATKRDAGQVTTRSSEAGDEAIGDRVAGDKERNRDRRGGVFRNSRRRVGYGQYQIDLAVNEVGGHRRQPVKLYPPMVFDRDVSSLGVTGFAQSLTERIQPSRASRDSSRIFSGVSP